MPAPAAPANAPANSPIAVIGPTPGINAAITSGPADSPAAPPSNAPIALPIPGCSVVTLGTDCNFPSELPGVKIVIRSSGIPVEHIWRTARSASADERNTPVTAFIVTTFLWGRTYLFHDIWTQMNYPKAGCRSSLRQDLKPTTKHSSRGHRKSTSLRFFAAHPLERASKSWLEADRVIPGTLVLPRKSRREKSKRPCHPFRFGPDLAGHGLRSWDGLVDRSGQRSHRRPQVEDPSPHRGEWKIPGPPI